MYCIYTHYQVHLYVLPEEIPPVCLVHRRTGPVWSGNAGYGSVDEG